MASRLNPKWLDNMLALLNATGKLDVTESYLPAIQALVMELSKRGTAYRIHNLGASVKRITTNTEICPCCKKKL